MRPDPLHQQLLSFAALRGRRVVVAVSGGRDSMVLLHALHAIQTQAALTLHVATFDHRLRAESQADAAFVAAWCAQHNIPCTIGTAAVRDEAAARQENIEATARRLRYGFLAATARTQGATALVTAHHADDQAETVLWHVVRGTGLDGLGGMAEAAPCPFAPDLTLYRPLLSLARADLHAYQQRHAVPFREDSSNADLAYTRNRLRHEVLPALAQLNPSVTQALVRLAANARDAQHAVDQQLEQALRIHAVCAQDGWRVPRRVFLAWARAVQARFVQRAFYALAPDAELGHERVQRALALAAQGRGDRVVELPAGVRVRVRASMFCVERTPPAFAAVLLPEGHAPQELTYGAPVRLAAHTLTMHAAPQPNAIAQLHLPAGVTVRLRARQTGDAWQPKGLGGHKQTLKKWFIDHKVPLAVRARVPLLEVNGRIAAVILREGWHISDAAAVTADAPATAFFTLEEQPTNRICS